MSDLFGHDSSGGFVDIRNQRPSVAEEKAALCKQLNELLRRTPKFLATASIQGVRSWKDRHKAALKVLQNKNSSRAELCASINSMSEYD